MTLTATLVALLCAVPQPEPVATTLFAPTFVVKQPAGVAVAATSLSHLKGQGPTS